ncbi:hypothetical protein PLEOSDRAFT_1096764 [Pleurotus ostreatus PC15]|uniref:Fungal-type protein kinase domain-containing protein n=1 Tax=Pleurotus ostreatus (strain PC15) TaxID=1137138 RepID=A0A067NHD6_PLEO1|nr:hypothetical protein PLEOSDRAFT_1096764 [Pleurotus ostreatus PC15]
MPPRRETTPFTTPPTTDISSPSALDSGVQNFAIYSQDAETIRTSLRLELAANIIEDQKAISGRLGLELVSSQLVDDCHSQLLRDKKDDIESLQDIVARAESKGDNAKGDAAFDIHMYKPLVDIIEFIASFGESKPKRRWIHSATCITGKEMPDSKPDLRLGDPSGELKTWRDLAAFGEVKPKAVQGMAPGQAIKASDALIRSGDYARLHLAGSPFRLFSIALMITGGNFQVGIFDRAGVVVSSVADMWTDTKTFIRVIRRLSCNLSQTEMGCDPSVFELPPHAELYPFIREKAKSLGVPPDSLDYPSFLVQCRKRISTLDSMDTRSRPDRDRDDWETHEWLTIGPPVWVSLSLLGRGTSIWRIIPYNQDVFDSSADVYILKNTWRNSHRFSESEIYETVDGGPDGVANFYYGGDVVFPYATAAISVTNIREAMKHYGSKGYFIAILVLAIYSSLSGLLKRGTVQFMAIGKLHAVIGTQSVPGFTDQVHHDLESFIWVFAYTVMRRLMSEKRLDSQSTKHIHKWFRECFCSLSPSVVASNRAAYRPLQLPCSISDDILPKPIKKLLACRRWRRCCCHCSTTHPSDLA